MRLIDLSQPLYDACPNCPVHPKVEAKIIATHDRDNWHMEHVSLASHTGSHIDAPLHKIAGGQSIDAFPLSAFVGPAHIVDLRGIGPSSPITDADLSTRLPKNLAGSYVLLATGWGDRRAADTLWHYQSPFLHASGARWLVEANARGVAIDHYSIGGSVEPANAEIHTILLSKPVLIVEDLRFPPEAFTPGQRGTFWALPIHFKGFSGAFCRPVLAVD